MVLSLHNITKEFKKNIAVKDLSFTVKENSVFGLLGPNGSGKTTIIKMISGLIAPSDGHIRLFDHLEYIEWLKNKVCIVPEEKILYKHFSAEKNLKIIATIKGITQVNTDTILDKVGLLEDKKKKVSKFSLGMKQRLLLSTVYLTNPEFIILDEPTNGMDAEGIYDIRQMILQFKNEHKTVLMASHLLSEVERVCTDILILKKGEKLFCDTIEEFLKIDSDFEKAYLNVLKNDYSLNF